MFQTRYLLAQDTAELDTVTTLSNGIRVATEALPGHFSAVGVYVDAGARYENDYFRGCAHIIDRLAFKSTAARSADDMLLRMEHLGGNVQAASMRETIMYQAAVFNKDVEEMTGLLAETVRAPRITDEEVETQLATAEYEIGEITQRPEAILPEYLHAAAFDGSLGNPMLCPEERLKEIDANLIREYRNVFYQPERIVVAFAGVDNTTAVRLAEEYFGDMPPRDEPFPEELNAPIKYRGGIAMHPCPPTPSYMQPLTHAQLAFESVPMSDPDLYVLATLQILMGGGGSFSAGGPGKGMYSRFYTSVLNRYGWIESFMSLNNVYKDSGLFGIQGSCQPKGGHALVEVMMEQFSQARNVSEDELARAKNQLRSQLLMNLESRMVELEDLGRQVLVYGKKTSVTEMSEKIRAVSRRDVRRVVEKMIEGKVSGAIMCEGGQVEEETTMEALKSAAVRWGVGDRSQF